MQAEGIESRGLRQWQRRVMAIRAPDGVVQATAEIEIQL
jgi:hypothetical protein